jgi:peroxidase
MSPNKAFIFLALLSFSPQLFLSFTSAEEDNGLLMNYYKESCPQAEEIIKEQVKLLYKRHKNTAFSWLRNIFHDCAVQVNYKNFQSIITFFLAYYFNDF